MSVSWFVVAVVALAVLLVVVAVLAATETAFTRVDRTRAGALAAADADDHGGHDHASDERATRLLAHTRRPITTLAGLALAGLLTQGAVVLAAWRLGESLAGSVGAVVAITCAGLAVFAAVAHGRGRAVLAPDVIAVRLVPVLAVIGRLATVTKPIAGVIRRTGTRVDADPDIDERQLLAIAETTPAIGGDEEELLKRVMAFDDQTVGSIMTPRTDMVTIASGLPVVEAVDVAARNGLSRIPVTAAPGDVDDIIGAVHVKDLWSAVMESKQQADVDLWLRDVTVVPELQRAAGLLQALKTSGMHLALVVDEHGGVAGVVTLEDILEELVGEIEDEFDTPEPEVVLIDRQTVQVDGRCEIPRIEAALGVELPAGSRTIAGCVFNGLGRVPEVADVLAIEGLEFEVLHMQGRRIARVEVRSTAPVAAVAAAGHEPS